MHQSDISPYGLPVWNCSERNQNEYAGYRRNQLSDDKAGDIAYYNDFLKNNIDFSESQDHFTKRREEGFFNFGCSMRDEMDPMENNFNKNFNVMFRPDFDLHSDVFLENKVVLPEKIAENLDSLEYNAQPTIPEKKSVNSNLDYVGTAGDQFAEFPYGQTAAIPQNFTQYSDAFPEQIYQARGPEQQYKPMFETQPTIRQLEESENNIMVNSSITSIADKLKMTSILVNTQSNQAYPSFLTRNINLSQPFMIRRKASLLDIRTAKTMSLPSSIESPELVKKWSEVSLNLHNEAVQSATTEQKKNKRSGKKKLKTAPPENTELKPNNSQHMKPEYSGIARTESLISMDNNMKLDDNLKIFTARSENMDYRSQANSANLNPEASLNAIPRSVSTHNPQINRNMVPPPQQGNNVTAPIANSTTVHAGNYARPPIKTMMGNTQQFGYNNTSSTQYYENPMQNNQEFGNQMSIPYERPINMNDSHEKMRTNNLNFNQTFNQQNSEPQSIQFKNNSQGTYGQAPENNLIETQSRNLLNIIKESPLKQQQYPQQYRQQLPKEFQQEPSPFQQSQQQQQQAQRQQQFYPQQSVHQNPQSYQQNPQMMRQPYPEQQQPQQTRQPTQKILPQQPVEQQNYQRSQPQQEFNQQTPLQQQSPQTQYSQQNPPRQLQQQQKQYLQQMQQHSQNQQTPQQQYSNYQQAQQFNSNQAQRYNAKMPPQQQQQPNGYQIPQQPSQAHQNQMMHQEINPNQKTSQIYPNQKPQMSPQLQKFHQSQQFLQNQQIHPNQQLARQPQIQQRSHSQQNLIPLQPSPYQKEGPQNRPLTNISNPNPGKQSPQMTDTPSNMPNLPHNPKILNQAASTFFSNNTPKDLFKNLQIPEELQLMKPNILEKIQNVHNRKIGTLTFQERKIKVAKYLEKRKQKTFDRKVNYQSRKKVADQRQRVKGRFATKDTVNAAGEQEAGARDFLSNEIKNEVEPGHQNNFTDMEPEFDEFLKSPFRDFVREFEKDSMFPEFDF